MITDSDIFTALRAYLLATLPAGVEVLQGQANRVASATAANFVIMTPGARRRLATNVQFLDESEDPTTRDVVSMFAVETQLDFHGVESGNNAQLIASMTQDQYGAEFFADNYPEISPLYCGDPLQMPFITGEAQWGPRWTLRIHLQISPLVTVAQQYAQGITVTIYPDRLRPVDFIGDNGEYVLFVGDNGSPLMFIGF